MSSTVLDISPTAANVSTKAQADIRPTPISSNGHKDSVSEKTKAGLRTGLTAQDIQLSNRFDALGLCAVTC